MKKLALLGLMFLSGCGLNLAPEEGTHSGYISDVSVEGLFCKTMGGQIMSGNGNSAMHYNFTVTDPVVFDKIRDAQKEKREVVIHYRDPGFWWICNGNGTFVSSVESI